MPAGANPPAETGQSARWLGIDHGTRRIGLAVVDASAGIATPVGGLALDETLHRRDLRQGRLAPDLVERVRRLAGEYQVCGIVVGWPVNADGTEGPQGRLARRFASLLTRQTGMDVRLWDERWSSFEADRRLRGRLTRAKKRRRHDSVAAAAILEDFLSGDGPRSAPAPDEAPRSIPEGPPAGLGAANGRA